MRQLKLTFCLGEQAAPPRDNERELRDEPRHRDRDSRDSRDSRDRYSRGGSGHDRERGRDGDRVRDDRNRDDRNRDLRDRDSSRRDRDRRDRYEYRRERDREREQVRRSRPSERDIRDTRENKDGRDSRGGDRRRDDRSRSDRFGDRHRTSHRSRSPEKRHRGPAEDLSNVIAIDKRVRMNSLWDVKPPGYENVTTEMAKLSGLFPMAGAPRSIDYSKLQGLVPNLSGSENNGMNGQGLLAGPGSLLKLENSRVAKRLLISGFGADNYTHTDIAGFFNEQFKSIELDTSLPDTTPAVAQSFANEKGDLVVLEFQSAEIATIALTFDGGFFQDDDSKFVMQIRRPVDYITPVISALQIAAAEAASKTQTEQPEYKSRVHDSANKISIAGIPSYLNEEQIVEVLKAFGPLSAFQIIRDKFTKESRGIAFCEFQDSEVTPMACLGLNGMELGDGKLRVKLGSKGIDIKESAIPFSVSEGVTSLSSAVLNNNRLSRNENNPLADTPVLLLLNMVTPQELVDDTEYKEIKEDIEKECSKFGHVEKIIMPRPDPKSVAAKRLTIQVGPAKASDIKIVHGAGKVFVKFDSHDACRKAHNALGGRRFSDRTVISSYFPEENFNLGIF